MTRIGSRSWTALRRGVLLAAVPFFAFTIADLSSNHPDWPLFQRGSYVYLFYWPTIFWSHGDSLKDRDVIATILINITVYSLIAFLAALLVRKRS